MRRPCTLAEKFWPKVAIAGPDDCWLWTAALHGQRHYGQMRATPDRDGNVSAHVVSWFLTHGAWPTDGLFVCHTCDVSACVNPRHLFLGTHTDNMQDSIRKGRNGMATKPERAIEGVKRWNQEHPTRPQTSGDRNGMRLHPGAVQRGEKHPSHKLTDSQWEEVFALWQTGQWTQTALGKHFGISHVRIGVKLRAHNTSLKSSE